MTDHPVLIPTSEGPVGGIVSEPPGQALAGLLLLPGYGRPGRSGINSFWTRLARGLCQRGLVVLRVDYSREGETLPIGEGGSGRVWKYQLDMRLLGQVLQWFGERLDGLDLLLAGSCSGARAAIDLAGRDHPDAVAGTFLIVPHLQTLAEVDRRSGDEAGKLAQDDAVDSQVVESFRTILRRAPSWILIGEHDTPDVGLLRRLLGPTAHDLEVEVVPDLALHLMDRPHLQQQTEHRLAVRIDRALHNSEIIY